MDCILPPAQGCAHACQMLVSVGVRECDKELRSSISLTQRGRGHDSCLFPKPCWSGALKEGQGGAKAASRVD